MVERLRARGLLGEMAAEFTGTLILILFGCGVVAQVSAADLGGHDSISWAWGFGVVFGVYVSYRITGGHINPAVTIALATFKELPWRKVAPYCFAQIVGAFLGALLVRWNYTEVLAKVDPGHTLKTQTVFSTLPGNGDFPVGDLGALRDQIIGTAILLLLVKALTDMRNTAPKANLIPVTIGLVVVGIGMAFGTDAGYAINPARDFGPRLASFITGYHSAWLDQYGNPYFWVPIVGPIVGGVLGVLLYKLLIARFLPTGSPEETLPDQVETPIPAPPSSAVAATDADPGQPKLQPQTAQE